MMSNPVEDLMVETILSKGDHVNDDFPTFLASLQSQKLLWSRQ